MRCIANREKHAMLMLLLLLSEPPKKESLEEYPRLINQLSSLSLKDMDVREQWHTRLLKNNAAKEICAVNTLTCSWQLRPYKVIGLSSQYFVCQMQVGKNYRIFFRTSETEKKYFNLNQTKVVVMVNKDMLRS